MRLRNSLTVATAIAATVLMTGTAAAESSAPELISVSSKENPLDAVNHRAAISADGKRVAFVRTFGDDASYVYVRDRAKGTTKWLGKYAADAQIDFSADGSTVAVTSQRKSVRVIDAVSGAAKTMAGSYAAVSKPSISGNGRFVAFTGARSAGGRQDAYRWNVAGSSVQPVTSSGGVSSAVISGNAKHVAYSVGGHVKRRTIATGETYLVDASKIGEPGNATNARPHAMSHGGLYILFTSAATNLSASSGACAGRSAGCAFVRRIDDRGGATVVSRSGSTVIPSTSAVDMSPDAKSVAFVGQSTKDNHPQAYVYRTADRSAQHASVSAADAGANARVNGVSVDGDGSDVAYSTRATNLGSKVGTERVWVSGS